MYFKIIKLKEANELAITFGLKRALLVSKSVAGVWLHCSPESSGLSLRLEQGEDVSLSDGSLDVSHQSSVVGADEVDFNLCNTSSGACTRQKVRYAVK